ncbi:MAG: thiopeptide-type bacteriocin biosynthesis protein [Pseudonocardia sp.]|nr:thiopeptide-type bacteriocin biosynthesis protein [Pseudonocardia sp.]
MADRDVWVSAHLFHRGDLDRVITDAVVPVVDQLSTVDAIDGYFFLRYWEGGPHLRLRLRPRPPADASRVRAAVVEHCSRYFAEHPSPPGVQTAEEYRVLAQRMAVAERLTQYDAVLHPADTVAWIPYRPEHTAYGWPPTLTAVETHFVESSAIAMDLLTAGTPPGQRHAVALGMLMLTLAVCEPDLTRIARRLHAMTKTPRVTADDGYLSISPALRTQARELWAQASDTGSGHGPLASWLASIRTLYTQLTVAHALGQFAPTDADSPLSRLTKAAGPDAPAVAQVVLRCTHLLCNRLGIHTAAEAHLTSLVARALIDLADGKVGIR